MFHEYETGSRDSVASSRKADGMAYSEQTVTKPTIFMKHIVTASRAERLSSLWHNLLRSYRRSSSVRLLLLGGITGMGAGLVAAGFFLALEWVRDAVLVGLVGIEAPPTSGEGLFHGLPAVFRPWLLPLLLGVLGLLTGWLVQRLAPQTLSGSTDGTDTMIKAFHRQGGILRARAVLVRGLTSILTLGLGGSAGREGPVSLMGAGVGSWIARRLKLSARERRMLLLAGAAGGLGAVFRAPLGGALTAIEVIYKEDFEAEAILPAVLSSVVAYSLFKKLFGTSPIFTLPHYSFSDARELVFYGLLGLLCAAAGYGYVRCFRFFKDLVFEPLYGRIGPVATMGLGGFCMGLLGMTFPMLVSDGYGWLEQAMLGKLALWTTLATSLTLGSGLSGGMFAPALFVGGMCGGFVGYGSQRLFPDVVHQPGGYVLVGMASFFAGVARAPIGPLLMVCELSRGYGLLAPLMLASAIALVLQRRAALYENQVENKFSSPAHTRDMAVNILERLQVGEVYQQRPVQTVPENATLQALAGLVADSAEQAFPVLDKTGALSGLLLVDDVRSVLFEETLYEVIRARDIARPPVYLRPDYDLYTALMAFVGADVPQIPVLDENDALLGTLQRKEVFTAYSKAVQGFSEE